MWLIIHSGGLCALLFRWGREGVKTNWIAVMHNQTKQAYSENDEPLIAARSGLEAVAR